MDKEPIRKKLEYEIEQIDPPRRKKLEYEIHSVEEIDSVQIQHIYNFAKKQVTSQQKAHHLYQLMYNMEILCSSYNLIKSNFRSTTSPMQREDGGDKTNRKDMEILGEQLEQGKYTPKPVRRIYIQKTGKNKVGIPVFRDRVVQASVNRILTVLYEPEFNQINTNFGFRRKKSAQKAIEQIKNKAKGMTTAIEGHMEGAYDKVNFKTLKKILDQKIEDKKFKRLIDQFLKAGYMEKDRFIESDIGVPQANIVSPTLFNIYANEMDKFIKSHLTEKFKNLNIKQNRDEKGAGKTYETYGGYIKDAKKRISTRMKGFTRWEDLPRDKKQEVMLTHKQIKSFTLIRGSMKLKAPHRMLLRSTYTRYADHWIILTNCTLEIALEIKTEIENWLEKNLQLKFNPENTLVTDITKEYAKFLGFTLKNTVEYKAGVKQRSLYIGIDHERVCKRLILKRFAQETQPHHGTRCPLLIVLEPYYIIEKYSQIISGIINYYYASISTPSSLARYHHIMQYSCLHTIAAREKKSIAATIGKYGLDPEATIYERRLKKGEQEIKPKKMKLNNFKKMREINERLIRKKAFEEKPAKETLEQMYGESEYLKKFLRKDTIENVISFVLNT